MWDVLATMWQVTILAVVYSAFYHPVETVGAMAGLLTASLYYDLA